MCSVDWKLVLEYLKVFLSWPVIIGVGAIFGAKWFRSEISALINRIASFEIAGAKVVTQQSKAGEEDANAQPVPPNNDIPAAVQNPAIPQALQEAIRAAFTAERAAARLWEYHFLNYFFAPTTQFVLDWLITVNVTTEDAFEAYWIHRIPQAAEREAVRQALQKHICIVIDGPAITVTDKGREYQAWEDRRILGFDARVPVPPPGAA